MRSKKNATNNSCWRMGKKLHLQKHVVWKNRIEKQRSRQGWWSLALFTITSSKREAADELKHEYSNKHLGLRTQICLTITTSAKTACQFHVDQNQKIAVKLAFRENNDAVVQSIQPSNPIPISIFDFFLHYPQTHNIFPHLSGIEN